MAKAPRLGLVKTRLLSYLPSAAVLELYRCLLADTLALAASLRNVEVAIMCPASDVEDLSRATSNAVHVVAQRGEGLAAGLTSVFVHFATTSRQRIIALNSDSPHLSPSVLQSAFEVLAACDLIVGPTHDGGYYLVGARECYPGLFIGDGIGTSNALEALLARASALNLSVRFADPIFDIDVPADLVRLAAELQFAPARAPRTAAWLLAWRRAVGGSSVAGDL